MVRGYTKGNHMMSDIVVYLSDQAASVLRGTFPFMRDDIQYFFTCTDRAMRWEHGLMIVPCRLDVSGADGIHWTTKFGEVALSERLIDYYVKFTPDAAGADRLVSAVADGMAVEEAGFLGTKHWRVARALPRELASLPVRP